jgi:hypothetical protein
MHSVLANPVPESDDSSLSVKPGVYDVILRPAFGPDDAQALAPASDDAQARTADESPDTEIVK